jgi:hypothetical protein
MHYLLSFVIVCKNDTAPFSEVSNFKHARGTKRTKRTGDQCNKSNKSNKSNNAFRHAVQVAHGVFAPGPTVCH